MKNKHLLIIFLTAFLSCAVQAAGEGALSLTTEPREADIYVDGELKANSTPLVLKLSAGRHTIEAKKGNQSASTEVFISDGAVVAKKLVLGGAPVIVADSIEKMVFPEQDAFETDAEFQARRKKLRKDFNLAVEKQDPRFQAGTATLDKSGYDIETGKFPIQIEWRNWAKKLSIYSMDYITASRDEARALWQEGQKKAVFITLSEENAVKSMLIGLNKTWTLSSDKQITVSGRTYIAYDNGTALDTKTGLMWMRCLVGQTWTGSTCSGEGKGFNWEDATKQSANFAGHSDWRIPTIQELRTLVYCSSGKPEYFQTGVNFSSCNGDYQHPTIAQSVFPNTPSSVVWSGSPRADYSDNAWYVYFRYGDDYYDGNRGNYLHVRLVRGGQ